MTVPKATAPRITVVGSYATGLTMKVERLPCTGETLLGTGYRVDYGGKGSNQAVGSARLGAKVNFVARIGKDTFGEMALGLYRDEGIDVAYVRQTDGVPTGVGFIMVEGASGNNCIAIDPGANELLSADDISGCAAAFESTSVVLTQLEIPVVAADAALRLGRAGGAITILNPAPVRPLPPSVLQLTDVLTPNQVEAKVLTGRSPDAVIEPEKLARELIRSGVKQVVLTLGERGALIVTSSSSTHVPAVPMCAVDTTGAGDAFNAGLATALASGAVCRGHWWSRGYKRRCNPFVAQLRRGPGLLSKDRNDTASLVHKQFGLATMTPMPLLLGFLLVLLAGLLQGTFILPMTLVRKWSWEHTWATFSLLGMIVFNWIITLLLVPSIFAVYVASPPRDLAILALFGLGWGIGAVLFGLGMARLGMALGYPIIMGLIASLGALIPLLVFFPQTLFTARGLVLLAGTAIVIVGIAVCSVAGSRRTPSTAKSNTGPSDALTVGLVIAVLAGILSCLPNVGMAFAKNVTSVAETMGVSRASSGNTVWALLFTLGSLANLAYCLYLMFSKNTFREYWNVEAPRNLSLSALMALMWIGSFYLYGAGAARLGRWGLVAGWPLFISISIVTGNIWGLWRGEWQGAPVSARRLLNLGLVILIVAVIVVAISSSV